MALPTRVKVGVDLDLSPEVARWLGLQAAVDLTRNRNWMTDEQIIESAENFREYLENGKVESNAPTVD